MLCDDVVVNLPDYILGKVEPNLRKCIENHLEICPRCTAELEEMREPIRVLGEVEQEKYPDAFWQELHALIMEKASKPKPVEWRVPVLASGLAVLLLAIGIGIYEFALRPAPQVRTVAALATSLPSDQAISLPSLNVNYVDAVSSQANEIDEMDAVDDSVQQAVVKSMWTSISDSTASLDDFDYLGSIVSN